MAAANVTSAGASLLAQQVNRGRQGLHYEFDTPPALHLRIKKPLIPSANPELKLRPGPAQITRSHNARQCSSRFHCRAQAASDQSPSPQSPSPRKRVTGKGCRILGTGSAAPAMKVTNDYLSTIVDTTDQWISTRTGIRTRRVLAGDETMTGLATQACRQALSMAGVDPSQVDLIVFCTSSPDDIFGGACLVQRDLGCPNAVAFDLTAACSGFVLGLVTASRFIHGGGYSNVLVVGADALSRYVDWTDRGTCILFGDGCGAVLLQATGEGEESALLGFDMKSDGHGSRHLNAHIGCSAPVSTEPLHTAPIPAPHSANGAPQVQAAHSSATEAQGVPVAVAVAEEEGSEEEASTSAKEGAEQVHLPGRAQPNPITMNGREVYKFAVTSVPQVLNSAMQEAGIQSHDVDWLVLHQANQRILDAVSQKMGIPTEKVLSNVANYGNTSAASIPLVLDEAVRSGKVKPGDVLAMAGFGAGLTWAGAVLRYG